MIARRLFVVPAAVLAVGLALVTVLSMNSGPLAPAPANAVPANDNLANAIPITAPQYSGMVAYTNTTGATFEVGEVSPCGAIGATAWYTWTSPASPGTITFETLGSDFDTVLAIYTGTGFPLSSVACSDDWLQGNKSAITLSYAASTTYRIQVGGWNGSSGNAALYVGRGATIVVSSTSDANADDGQISLREAMLLARGGTGATGINRVLGGGEVSYVFNAGSAGPSGFDVIHFSPSLFLSASPVSILVPISDGLPFLDSTGDTITGVGAGVVIDGQNTLGHDCLTVTGASNHLEGLEVRRCLGGYEGIRVQGPANVIGGSITPAQRNVARENSLGIAIDSASAIGNVVVGNYIGTDRTGTIGMGNEDAGIFVGFGAYDNTIGGPAPNDMNLISDTGPAGTGIKIRDSDSNQVYGNKVGTDVTGTVPFPNDSYGITIDVGSLDNIIGGISPGQANVVANSTGNGVRVDGIATLRNSIRGNSIHSSSVSGIDLLGGANASLPAPTITNVAGGAVSGFTCSLCIVDVYNDTASQGRIYLGTDTADVAGSFVLYDVAHALANITATVTDSLGNTSEFSAPYSAATNSDGDSLSDFFDGCVFDPEDYDGWDDGDGCPDPDNDGDGVCDAGMASVGCTGNDLGRYLWKNPLGSTVDCRNVAEDFDSFHDGDGCPEPDNDYDTYSDADDACDGSDANAGPDGIADTGDEPVLYLTPYQAREDFDGVIDWDGCHDSPNDDYDGDGAGDEEEVFTMQTDPVNPDTDADTVVDGTDNCPNWANASQSVPTWTIPANDSDCDGFNRTREEWTGTNPTKHCNLTTTANDEAIDFWPSDFNDSRLTSLSDVVLMGPAYNQSTGTDPAKKRFDLNASGIVSLADVVLMGPFYNKGCG